MRVLVCGGRNYGETRSEREKVYRTLDAMPIQVVIEGGALGADYVARAWAKLNAVPVETFEADWKQYGKAAGPRRNQQMLEDGKPDVVVAFPGGRGTADMVRRAKTAGVTVIDAAALNQSKGE